MWVDAWQMQCCGDPFAVGETVSWKLSPADHEWLDAVVGTTLSQSVQWKEQRHDLSDGVPETAATVREIQLVRCRYAPTAGDPRTLYPVQESAELTPVDSADGLETDNGGASFVGYLVTLRPWVRASGGRRP